MDWMKDFFLWDSKDEGNTCVLTPIQGIKKTYRLQKGVGLIDAWPPEVYFSMDPEYPKDIGLADNLDNLDGVVVVTKFLKEFLELKKLKNVEYLPVSIMNHKGRFASRDYFLVNPIIPQDCVDLEKSEPTYYDISPTKIQHVKQLVIDPKRIDPDVKLFRLKNFGRPVVIRAELAQEISAQPFTGIRWNDPLKFKG